VKVAGGLLLVSLSVFYGISAYFSVFLFRFLGSALAKCGRYTIKKMVEKGYRMQRIVFLIIMLIIVLFASSVVKTGQTKSYDQLNREVSYGSVKDDGYYKAGVGMRYTRNSKGIVTDHATGLEWDDTSLKIKSWYASRSYCNGLALDGGGWRVPTLRELETLVNYAKCCPSMDTSVFQNVPIGNYWSSDTYEGNSDKGWLVRFRNWGYSCAKDKTLDRAVKENNETNTKASDDFYVRCVRGNSYEDSNLYRSSDGIVHDLASGLDWQDNIEAKTVKKKWIGAIKYCEDLSLGSYTDWRLPNQKELLTIADRSRYNPAIDNTVFQNIGQSTDRFSPSYWSSTTRIEHPTTIDAWHVHFRHGFNYYNRKDTTRNVRCVRDAGNVPGNISPTAEAGSDKSTEVNHPVTITGNGSDPDGTIVSYEWKKGSMVLATTATFDYTPDTVGTDTLTLTVTDDDGATDTDTMKVTVTDPNAPPADEYTRANEIVTDHVRGLQWQDTSYSQADKNTYNSETSESQRARQWIHAEAYCSSLNLEGGGWRLPTINELDTLIDHDETNPAINPIFQNALGLGTWSGTTYQENTSQAWGIGFYSGGWHHCTKNNKSKLIMCVRDMTSN
jgi:hypothetical protein